MSVLLLTQAIRDEDRIKAAQIACFEPVGPVPRVAFLDEIGAVLLRAVAGQAALFYAVENAYTNVMAAWVLRTAAHALALLDEKRRRDLREDLALADEELIRWEEIGREMEQGETQTFEL